MLVKENPDRKKKKLNKSNITDGEGIIKEGAPILHQIYINGWVGWGVGFIKVRAGII